MFLVVETGTEELIASSVSSVCTWNCWEGAQEEQAGWVSVKLEMTIGAALGRKNVTTSVQQVQKT